MELILGLIALLLGIIGGVLGKKKGRSSMGFWLSFLLGPVGLLITIFLEDHSHVCPECGGFTVAGSRRCKHCGQAIFTDHAPSVGSVNSQDDTNPSTLPCPYCQAPLDSSQMVHGPNRCVVCRRVFNAD